MGSIQTDVAGLSALAAHCEALAGQIDGDAVGAAGVAGIGAAIVGGLVGTLNFMAHPFGAPG